MQTVSPAWKQAHTKAVLPESLLTLSCRIGDPDAQRNAQVSSSQSEPFCHPAEVIVQADKQPTPFTCLEQNSWILDGTRRHLPETVTGYIGFVSSVMSTAQCYFLQNPSVSFGWAVPQPNLIGGVTITWSTAMGEMARDFTVRAWLGNTLTAEKTVTGNTKTVSAVELNIQNYDRITVEVTQWCLPFSRARMEDMVFGLFKLWSKADIVSFRQEQSVDMMSGSLPKSAIKFDTNNLSQEFNPDAEDGFSRYLMERQEVVVSYGLKLANTIEWIPGGVFYLTGWETPQNGIISTFFARDAVDFLQDAYTGIRSGTLLQIAEAALAQAKLPLGFVHSFHGSLANNSVNLTGEKYDYTLGETLQMIANAAMCVLYQDRQSVLRIEPYTPAVPDYSIDKTNSYEHGEYTISKPLRRVVVNKNLADITVSTRGETLELTNPFIQTATHAVSVANWIAQMFEHRKTISGSYRGDPRIDALDTAHIQNKYAANIAILTDIELDYKGAFSGKYKGIALNSSNAALLTEEV
ncbi:MAG: hypothetical protein RSD07_00950 [Angelakisella sp.]